MQRLAPGIELYQPIVSNGADPQPSDDGMQPQPPQLIILATWMVAKPAHVSKYVAGYQAIYPSARIMVIRSSIRDMLFRTYAKRRALLQPAIQAIPPSTPSPSSSSSSAPLILLHAFSNGGASQTRVLLRAHPDLCGGAALPPHATILDSCPGRGSVRRSYAALASSLPHPLLRALLSPALVLVLALYWLAFRPWGVADPIERVRAALNMPTLAHETVRCYVYGEDDVMVDWRDVEAHARDARAAGFARVRMEKFAGTAHCAHIKGTGAARYWAVVQETWRSGAIGSGALEQMRAM